MINNIQSTSINLGEVSVNDILNKNWQWLLGLGIALVALGTVSILMASLTTIISVIIFGAFLLINGAMLIYQAIKIWWRQWRKFSFHLSIGILYALVGFIFIILPVHGAFSLTLMLALFYIMLGTYRGILAVTHKIPGWHWMLLSSLVTVILGIIILMLWPTASLWIIGTFIGVDIIIVGWAFIMSALSARGKIGFL